MPLTVSAWIVVNVLVFLGSIVQGSLGFGMGMVSAPLLVLFAPQLVPGPLIFAATLLLVFVGIRDRTGFDYHGLGWALAGRVPGSVLGAGALALLPARGLSIVFGVLILLAVTISILGRIKVEPRRPTQFAAGLFSGLMSSITSIGGPPMALLYQHAGGRRLRATLSCFFTVGGVFSLVALAMVGKFGYAELHAGMLLVPAMLLGFLGSRHVMHHVDRGGMRHAVLAISAFAGLLIIGREIF